MNPTHCPTLAACRAIARGIRTLLLGLMRWEGEVGLMREGLMDEVEDITGLLGLD
jgi:hypothetical protein